MSVDALLHDLLVDRVIEEGVAVAWYGVSRRAARRAGVRSGHAVALPIAKGSRQIVRTRFWARAPRHLHQAPNSLRHLAGATSLRLHLGASTDDWRNDAARHRGLLVPDALWLRPDPRHSGGRASWAIEVDTGSYSGRQVREKARVFGQHHGRQIWAVQSERRRVFILTQLARVDVPYPRVEVAPWWGGKTPLPKALGPA